MKYYWAIYSGKILLPFTIRTTKKQCIADHEYNTRRAILEHESCSKVSVEKVSAQTT